MRVPCSSLPEIPEDTPETNPLLRPFSSADPLPQLEGVTERQCYFGLGKALLEFESAVCRMEEKCKGEKDGAGQKKKISEPC